MDPDGCYKVELPRVNNNTSNLKTHRIEPSTNLSYEISLWHKNKLQDFETVLKEHMDLDHAEVVPTGEPLS